MHDLIKELTEYLGLTPEQQFRVTAKIKRHIHSEKASVFHRYFLYSQGDGIYDYTNPEEPVLVGRKVAKDAWLNEVLKEKFEQHQELSHLPDEELVTWSVGTHNYQQKVAPCSVCGVDLTGKPRASRYSKGVSSTFCEQHIPEDMKSQD